MMLKVANDYLDFNDSVEVERKAKLFENIDSTDGDVSFQFEVPETSKNTRLLNYPVPDSSSKSVYHRIDCDLQDDSGVSIYFGFLRVERRLRRDFLSLSFFSGNSNWFGLISGNLQDMDMSQYDIEQTEANIISSWNNTSGITFPLVDNGGLLTRSFPQVKVEDLVAAFFVHTVVKKIFQDAQIKITGELFEEPLYNKLITIKNSKSQTQIDARSTYASKDSLQEHIPLTPVHVTWDDDSTFPYHDGVEDNFSTVLSEYVPDVKLQLKIEVSLGVEIEFAIGPGGGLYTHIFVNGVEVEKKLVTTQPDFNTQFVNTTFVITADAGDEVEVHASSNVVQFGLSYRIVSGTVKITPNFIYKAFGESVMPNWTKQEYISNIFQLFNVITSFDPKTKTLTCNLFDKIKEKPPIDISQYVKVDEIDYESFISGYGRQSKFSYTDIDFGELKDYNIANFFNYGHGIINVDNDFLPENQSIIELDFSSPFSYSNGIFDMSMERVNLIEFEEGNSLENSGVSDASGNARFAIPEDVFQVGDLVRIVDQVNPGYNGDWVVSALAAGWVEFLGIGYDGDSTGTLTKLDYSYNATDDVFLLVNIATYPLANFSGNEFIYLEDNGQASWGLAYFSLLNTNRQINIDYKQSLSFGAIQDPLFYQRTILQTYWSLVERVLNDPVKPICTAVMPTNVYKSIDFLRPLMIKTLETSNLYYCNLLSGYNSSSEPFAIELIKLP